MSFEFGGTSVQHLTGVAFQMILLYCWLFGIDHDVLRLGIGDELQVVSNVVQKDPKSFRHMKDQQTKMAHCFVRVLRGSN